MKSISYGFRSTLFNILNSYEFGTSEYSIAEYLLKNFTHLQSLTVNKISFDCNVSRISVYRFFNNLGYRNFSDFKTNYINEGYGNKGKKLKYSYYSAYIDRLTIEIQAMLEELKHRMNTSEVDVIAEAIYRSEKVYFVTNSKNLGTISHFQSALVLLNKLVYAVSNFSVNEKVLNQISSKDLLMVVSIGGGLARQINPLLANNQSEKILITLNRSSELKALYKATYYLSKKDIHDIENEIIYNTYGLTFMLDIILNSYAMLLQNKGE